jgi:glycosyltransferase involved in cell wall biosynthesis
MTSVHQRYDGRIFRKECKSLSLAGYDVSLIVADGKKDETVDDIKIYDIGKVDGRINRFIKTTKNIKKLALILNCEVYHFHDPELLFVGLALKRSGKKVIFDMHENVPGDIEEKGYIHPLFRKLISYCYQRLEIYAVKKFDAIVSTRESINERLNPYNSNIELITNFPIVEKNIVKINDPDTTICFAGAVISNWRHKEVINAIENIDSVKYLLAGPTNEDYINELRMLKGWTKVDYIGRVPYDRVKAIYQMGSIGVAIYIYCRNMDGKTGNLANTKLFEYMNWEIPIICTDFSLWKEIIVDEIQCGICVNPYDINAISKAIEYLIENPEIARQMGKNGRKAVLNRYNWDTQALKLVALYEKIIEA